MDTSARPAFIVVLGASAGGLDALRDFFAAAVPDPRIAYVVITHLPPDRPSHMAELLGRSGAVPVREARAGDRIAGGQVHVLPPGQPMQVQGDRFVAAGDVDGPPPHPIDTFMRSLAGTAGARAAGIVLSGSDNDGTAGLVAIRAAGGLTLVQAPDSATFPGMPNSAIAAGCVDHVLAPRAMVPVLMAHVAGGSAGAGLPREDGPSPQDEEALRRILDRVLAHTGHDFRDYRPGMLRRRVRRRMAAHGLTQVDAYERLLDQSDAEATALAGEFLIGVTSFFRDPQAWADLDAHQIAPLVAARRGTDQPVRVWTPGCSTGEETYSIAMLLLERLGDRGGDLGVQVFGTDIDVESLAIARQGRYPSSIEAAVSPERRARFFDPVDGDWVVGKALRDAVLFAPQNMVRDTPFSRLDLVVCRNVLMYFEPALQDRMVQLFHFSLRPGGLLWLGPSELIQARPGPLFEPVPDVGHLYRRLPGRAFLPRGFAGPVVTGWPQAPRRLPGRALPDDDLVRRHLAGRDVDAAVLVDAEGRALLFHGDVGPFLAPRGEATLELVRLLRPELRPAARRALRQPGTPAGALPVPAMLSWHDGARTVQLRAEAVEPRDDRGLVLVVFSTDTPQGPAASVRPVAVDEPDRPWPELEASRRDLARALEDAEHTNDELRLAGEEASSLNEELQSANEELESSREELQSLNEELATVNAQLEEKASELARTADDLANLIESTGIATVLLDAGLRVRRFTPAAGRVYRLRPGDEGRELGDVASRVNDPGFGADAARVLAGATVPDVELADGEGRILLRRLQPYRSTGGREPAAGAAIDGVVATYVDVTGLRNAARQSRQLMTVLADSNDAVIGFEPSGRIVSWNAAAARTYGWSRGEDIPDGFFGLTPPADRAAARGVVDRALALGSAGPESANRRTRDGRLLQVSMTLAALRDETGGPIAVLSTERDLTERLRADTEIRFRRLADDIPALLRVEDVDGLAQFVNRSCSDFTGRDPAQLLGHGWLELIHPLDRERYVDEHTRAAAAGTRFEIDLRLRRHDGHYRWMRSVSVPHRGGDGVPAGQVALMLDVEDRVRAEAALVTADQRKDEFLAMLAHELRNPLAPIRSAVRLILTPGVEPGRAQWAAGVIDRQTQTMSILLDSLLDVARIARGKLVLQTAPLELRVALERAVEVSQPLVDARRQTLRVALPGAAVVVDGDLVRLTQVFANLINNAAKYTQDGGRIDVSVQVDEREVTIGVRDNGAGMTRQTLDHVFELFVQADRTLDRAKGGLGIGLTLVRQLVELHGGQVTAHSEGLGHGSLFLVKLPRMAVPKDRRPAAGPDDPARTQDARAAQAHRVLVVDDNAEAALMLAEILKAHGHAVAVAHDGVSAIEMADRQRPDVVLLDIGLPGLDGFQVARTLRGRSALAGVTLLALSGYGRPEDMARATEAGFDDYFVKPCDPLVLVHAVEAARRLPAEGGTPSP